MGYRGIQARVGNSTLSKSNYAHCYTLSLCKALLLLAYLIRNGSERVVTSAREHIYDLRSLENYHFIGESPKPNEPSLHLSHLVFLFIFLV